MEPWWAKLIPSWDQAKTWLVGIIAYLKGQYDARQAAVAKQTADTLDRVQASAKAASAVDVLSDDDIMRQLKQRGMYRVLDQQGGGKQ